MNHLEVHRPPPTTRACQDAKAAEISGAGDPLISVSTSCGDAGSLSRQPIVAAAESLEFVWEIQHVECKMAVSPDLGDILTDPSCFFSMA